MNCIEKGTKLKLRFPIKGQCSIEDLWDIDLPLLDEFAMSLETDLEKKQKSYIVKKTVKNPTNKLMFDITVRIIDIRIAEIQKNEQSQENKLLREQAARILANREDSAMEELSDKELKKIIKG